MEYRKIPTERLIDPFYAPNIHSGVFFHYKKVWYYFDISIGVENCNNDLISCGDFFGFVSGLRREGSIPRDCLDWNFAVVLKYNSMANCGIPD